MAVSKATNLGIDKHRKRMGAVVMAVQKMVVASSLRGHTTASTRSERTTSAPPPPTDGLLRSAMAASPKSMFPKPLINNRLCNRASLLTRSPLSEVSAAAVQDQRPACSRGRAALSQRMAWERVPPSEVQGWMPV